MELDDKFNVDTTPKASHTLTDERDTTADGSGLKDKNVATEIIWSAKKHTDSYIDSDVMTPSNNTLEMLALPDGVMFSKAVITSEDGVVVYIVENKI